MVTGNLLRGSFRGSLDSSRYSAPRVNKGYILFLKKEGIMATVSTLKHPGVIEVWGRCCLSIMKGLALITGGIGGLVLVAVLLFPLFLIISFLLKAFGL